MNVLVSLHPGYGLGDAVQMSAVLRHVRKYRPHWCVDFQAQRGQECVGRDLTENQFVFGDRHRSLRYDFEVQILLFDTWANWHDRPNTRVSSTLRERFDIEWDADCGRYQVGVRPDVLAATAAVLPPDAVAVHYLGDSSPDKKNLSHSQAGSVCGAVRRLGCCPVLMDWRGISPLKERSLGNLVLAPRWGGDAEVNCGVIRNCQAFVGIDSGPAKCASSTDTPALVVWTGHHPAPFHDPAPNTTHLVPRGYHGLEPVCGDRCVVDWFEAHYSVRQYDTDPTSEIKRWLEEVLK